MPRRFVLAAILPGLLLLPSQSRATWPENGVVISAAVNQQNVPKAVPDGAGGAIMVWEDSRAGGSFAIYAQRVDALGVPQWTPDGVAVSSALSDRDPQLIPDGAGGAMIAWSRNGDVYAQRLSAAGAPLWTAGGVVISAATGAQQLPTLVSDNAGGAIITWQDLRGGVDYDVYVRRVNGSGVPQWAADGVAVCTAPGSQGSPQIVVDGFGGAVITWSDNRVAGADIYVQRVNSAGGMPWAANGVGLCTAADVQTDPSIISDGSGGAIVAWEDNRSLNWDVYARRIASSGFAMWTANGVALSALANPQMNPVLLPDGLGGAFAAWDDARTGFFDIYVQRLNSLGAAQWTANGVALATTGGGNEPAITTDGLGGAIVAWFDSRSGGADIYARRINGSGVAQWTANGTALCTAAGNQYFPALASDGVGGAIVVWEDLRTNPSLNDVFAQRIERNGHWGYPSPEIVAARDVPGDQGGVINLSWDGSRLDPWPDELIDNYTVWRAIDATAAAAAIEAGAARVRDGIDPLPSAAREVVRVQQLNGATYYWMLMSTLAAYGLQGYSDVVPTLFDSTATSSENHYFQVIAHAAVGQWVSQAASGRSLDNLAPLAPLQLTAQRVGADVHLLWNQNDEPDLAGYAVYRHTSTGVTPIPSFFLSSALDTVLVDANAPANSLYYIVTAIDTHDNQGAKSNEASVSPVTGVGDIPTSYVLSVSNYPNPFNPRTTVSYTVPSPGEVKVHIYDARGAIVKALFEGHRVAGAYSIDWDGRADNGDAVASGLYFARIEHASGTRSKKMMLLK